MMAQGARAAGGQEVLDQGDGRAGDLERAAAVAHAVAAHLVHGVLQVDQVPGAAEGDAGGLGRDVPLSRIADTWWRTRAKSVPKVCHFP